jgi:hypothetical protein
LLSKISSARIQGVQRWEVSPESRSRWAIRRYDGNRSGLGPLRNRRARFRYPRWNGRPFQWRRPIQLGRRKNAENASTSLGECEWSPHRHGVSTGATYARRRQSTTWSRSATKQRPRNGAFTAPEPRAANRSKNRFAKSGARSRLDCQSSEPAFAKFPISADRQSCGRQALRACFCRDPPWWADSWQIIVTSRGSPSAGSGNFATRPVFGFKESSIRSAEGGSPKPHRS